MSEEGGGGGGGGGLGLTLQQLGSESLLFPCRRRMMMMVRPNHDRAGGGGGGGGGGDGHGPTTGSGGAEDNIYDVSGGSGGGGTVVVRTQLQQPFDISTTTTTTPSHTFKSPGSVTGGMMMAAFPFTTAQWKELELQAMIYKYMMASVPVPPELLIPITRNFSDSPTSTLGRGGSVFNLRFSNGGADPEPGRCRRTDGKKWRCSRDVAPNQKYCERHMHRGRPRSRKPVEVHTDVSSSHKKIRHCHPLPGNSATFSTPMNIADNNTLTSEPQFLGSGLDHYNHSPVFLYKSDPKAPPFQPLASVPSLKEARGLEWAGKGAATSMVGSEQQWQQLMQTKIGLTLDNSSSICDSSSSVFNQRYQEQPINLNSYSDFSAGGEHPGRDLSHMFFSAEAASLQKPQTETPRAFIDAWSIAVTENPANTANRSSVSSDRKLPLSSLTLSMGGCPDGDNGIDDDEMNRNQNEMGCSRITDTEKPQLSTWLNPAVWAAGSAPGGPLAEVLRLSSAAAPSNPASPHAGNGDSISPSGTAASSPSGVLHKPVVSPSDSSGDSSPTHHSPSPAKQEITFPWMNQSKIE